MNEMNRKRAAWAKMALDGFTVAKGEVIDYNDMRDEIGDLIADLLHLAKFKRFSVDQILAHSRRMFEGEVQDKE